MSSSGSPIADVSLEFAHVDVSGDTDEAAVRAELTREAVLVRPILTSLRDRGLAVSTCVLLDDTGAEEDLASEIASFVRAVATEQETPVDYFVRESVLVDTLQTLDTYFYPEIPPRSEGVLGTPKHVPTVDPVIANERWLENGEPGRDHPLPEPLRLPVRRSDESSAAGVRRRAAGGRGSRMHAIHIDVELWSQQRQRVFPGPIVWSVPMLAAWWQLLRLGAPTELDGTPLAPTADHDEAAAFCAYSTITVLPTEFLAVEHAVRTILGRVALPDNWIAPARDGTGPGPLEHLKRISYVFTSELPTGP